MSTSRLQPGDRIAILGKLQSGKTTLALGHAARWISASWPVVYVYQADSAARIRQHIVAHTHTDDAGDLTTIAWCHRDDIIGAFPNPLQDDTLIILDGWSDARGVYNRIVDSVPPSVTVIQVCWTAHNEDTTHLPPSFAGVFHPNNVFLPAWQALSPATRIGRVEEELDTIRSQITALYSRTSTRPPTIDVPAPSAATKVGSYPPPPVPTEIGTYRLTADGIHVSRTGHSAVTLAPHELVAWVTAGHHELRPDLGQHPPRLSGTIW